MIPEISAATKLKILRRENYLCQKCKTYSAKLTFHHIIPQRLYETFEVDKINDEKNLMLLCDKCHVDVHRDESLWTLEEIDYIIRKTQNKGTFEIEQSVKDEAIRKLHMIKHIVEKKLNREIMINDLEQS